MAIITLLTDFGTQDHYVAVMKGVILRMAPRAGIVDVTHDIGPQNVLQAAFVLRQTIAWYPPNTVHVAVVDPGVGSSRRILAGRYGGQIVIAPDNGLLSLVHRDMRLEELYAVEQERYFLPNRSSTFHGRDIFAPVAAHVATGLRLPMLGSAVKDLAIIPTASAKPVDGGVAGCVMHVDRFGNLVTNIDVEMLGPLTRGGRMLGVHVGDRDLGVIRNSYGDVDEGVVLALIGSSRTVEISVNGGRADEALGVGVGADVVVR